VAAEDRGSAGDNTGQKQPAELEMADLRAAKTRKRDGPLKDCANRS